MSANRRSNNPKPFAFVATGAIIGFIVFGVISWIGPNRNEGFDVTYDPGAALGYMSMLGLAVGALVGAVVVALLTYRK